jgi:hypothetical protein
MNSDAQETSTDTRMHVRINHVVELCSRRSGRDEHVADIKMPQDVCHRSIHENHWGNLLCTQHNYSITLSFVAAFTDARR